MAFNSKHKIGILLPQSNAYPAMGKSFLNGMRLAMQEIEYDLVVESIGSGSDPKQLMNSFQKLCYQENVKLTTGILGHHGFKELIDFASSNQEILLAANFGSKRPLELPNGVFQNSLGLYDSLQELTYYLAKQNKHNIATSSCYYESGYDFIEALDAGIAQSETTSFAGHFITPLHPRENESELMHLFFSEIQPDAIVAFHNGVFAKEHASYLNNNKLHEQYPLYLLPFSAEDVLLEEFPQVFTKVKTVSSWYPNLTNDSNVLFVETYQKQFGKKPGFFALLGYENGLVIKSTLVENSGDLSDIIQNISTEGPRGAIDFNNNFNKTNFNHYIWENSITKEHQLQRSILTTLDKNTFTNIKTEHNTGWFNTYLCH